MIDPKDFEKYLQLEAEAKVLKEKMILHAEKVAVAMFGQNAKVTGFGKNADKSYAYGYLSDDEGLHLPMEMLYAPDWEAQVAAYHQRQEVKHEKLMARWKAEREQQEKDRDTKELDRLKKKYPDMV